MIQHVFYVRKGRYILTELLLSYDDVDPDDFDHNSDFRIYLRGDPKLFAERIFGDSEGKIVLELVEASPYVEPEPFVPTSAFDDWMSDYFKELRGAIDEGK